MWGKVRVGGWVSVGGVGGRRCKGMREVLLGESWMGLKGIVGVRSG